MDAFKYLAILFAAAMAILTYLLLRSSSESLRPISLNPVAGKQLTLIKLKTVTDTMHTTSAMESVLYLTLIPYPIYLSAMLWGLIHGSPPLAERFVNSCVNLLIVAVPFLVHALILYVALSVVRYPTFYSGVVIGILGVVLQVGAGLSIGLLGRSANPNLTFAIIGLLTCGALCWNYGGCAIRLSSIDSSLGFPSIRPRLFGRSYDRYLYASPTKLLGMWSIAGVATFLRGVAMGLFVFFVGIQLFHLVCLVLGIIQVVYHRKSLLEGFTSSINGLDVRIFILFVITYQLVVLAAAWVGSYLSMQLRTWARRLSRVRFEQIAHGDPRPHILYLRSFANDQSILPPESILHRYWRAEPSPQKLDQELVERYSDLGPVVALGRRRDKDQLPFGAARIFLDSETDNWKAEVDRLAKTALAIVLVADNSPSLLWEIAHMRNESYSNKTLFLASPTSKIGGLEKHPSFDDIFRIESDAQKWEYGKILGCYSADGGWTAFSGDSLGADNYRACCNAFFRHVISLRDRQVSKSPTASPC